MTAQTADNLWFAYGILGQIVFQGRFYLQWFASERAGRSVVPITFWYASGIGAVMLLVFALHDQSPLGALGLSLNTVIYARNLVHIWRDQGRLSPGRNIGLHAGAAVVSAFAVLATVYIWHQELQITRSAHPSEATQTWIWLTVGLAGQALFACRFLIQWVATERAGRSVMPVVFWYVSLVAGLLMLSCFLQRREWVFSLGATMGLIIYGRNLWFIRRQPAPVPLEPQA